MPGFATGIEFLALTLLDEYWRTARTVGESESTSPRAKYDQGPPGTRLRREKLRRDAGSGRDHLWASSGQFRYSTRNSRGTLATQIERQLFWPPHRSPESLRAQLPGQSRLPRSPPFDI